MGCNCSKDKLELNLRKKLRNKTKEKFAEIKRLWQESKTTDTITTKKKDLNFK